MTFVIFIFVALESTPTPPIIRNQGIGGDFEAKIEELAANGAGVVVAAEEEVDERYALLNSKCQIMIIIIIIIIFRLQFMFC